MTNEYKPHISQDVIDLREWVALGITVSSLTSEREKYECWLAALDGLLEQLEAAERKADTYDDALRAIREFAKTRKGFVEDLVTVYWRADAAIEEVSTPAKKPDTVEALRLAHLIVSGDVDAWCDQDSDKLAAHALLRLKEQLEALRVGMQRCCDESDYCYACDCHPSHGHAPNCPLSNPASPVRVASVVDIKRGASGEPGWPDSNQEERG